MIVYKEIPFNRVKNEDIFNALKNDHAVCLGGVWYFPLSAEYKKSSDTIRYKLEQDLRAIL